MVRFLKTLCHFHRLLVYLVPKKVHLYKNKFLVTAGSDGIASITFANCTICDNSASNGGGLDNDGHTIYFSDGSKIENNMVSIGGGIYNQ